MFGRLAALVLLVSGASPSAKPRRAHVIETYRIEGKSVSAADFQARLGSLKGHAEYHCKKTTFGGVVTFKAQDGTGHWFRVTRVSGSDRPSTIEPTDPPESPEED